ncbi:MAG: AAA family ATPase [Nitrospirota bacterium]|jgi:general secretion pathway protein A
MYEQHFGLRENPFRLQANPDYLYLSPKHDKALATLEYGLAERKGFVVLIGEIGAGKTTLLNYVLGRLPEAVNVAFVFHTNLNKSEFLELILTEFEVDAPAEVDSERLYALYDFLLEEHRAGRRVVLMVDEAQNLAPDVLEQIRLLANLETNQQPLLQIILAGQPALRQTLGQPALEQLRQRVGVTYHLMALDEEDVGDYVRFRLSRAGAPRADLFETDTYPLIYRHTRGVPRLINKLADAALLAAFADDVPRVGRALLEEVIQEQQAEGEIQPAEVGPSTAVEDAASRVTDPVLLALLERLTLCVERLEEADQRADDRFAEAQEQIRDILRRVEQYLERLADIGTVASTPDSKKRSWFQ